MDVRSGAKIVGLLAVVVVGCEYLPSTRKPLARPEVAGSVNLNNDLHDQPASVESTEDSELARLIARDVKALQDLQSQKPLDESQQEKGSPVIATQQQSLDAVAQVNSEVQWEQPRGLISNSDTKRVAARTSESETDTTDAPDKIAPNIPGVMQGALGNADVRSVDTASTEFDITQDVVQQPLSDELRQMISTLRGEVFHQSSYSANPLRELLVLAVLPLIDPDGVLSPDTINAINSLTDRERELFSRIQDFYIELGRELSADSDSEESIVNGLTELLSRISTEPQLELSNPMLCTSVSGFGAYKSFGQNAKGGYSFLSLTSQQAVVYIEVDNFTSELNENSKWVTKLSQQLVIYNDRDGIPVWKQNWRPVVDVSGNKRKDFFVVQVITLTERLGLGKYQLKISLRDELSGAESETAIDLEMVADPSLVTAGVTR